MEMEKKNTLGNFKEDIQIYINIKKYINSN